jgi:glutathione S-transferase
VPTVKLHRCPLTFVHNNMDSCWKVQKALDDQGIEYEVIKAPILPRSRRTEVLRISGQHWLPMIEFEDGSAYRAESKEMAETIDAGRLFDHAGSPAPAG